MLSNFPKHHMMAMEFAVSGEVVYNTSKEENFIRIDKICEQFKRKLP
jgi:hypothetical protein